MNVTYVGKRGLLNEKLHALLSRKIKLSVISTLNFNSFYKENTVIYAARYLSQSRINLSDTSDSFIYLSTLVPNNFHDSYQKRKNLDSLDVLESGRKVIYIPFIKELIPTYIKKRLITVKSDYFIYITSINEISSSILELISSDSQSKKLTSPCNYLYLNKRERLMFSLFSFIYKRVFNYPYFLINFVKILEKTLQKILFCIPLSCVYINRR
ncbi:hypothetical protein [Photorhabdus namnaonensis]|uniref:Uncharacterized protein n=1 Tax=Photorhabdus namnaonensis TaxID=1851568 RepID=A0A1B8YN87_9GAMM|nr:hypothetical protein [Photorhabdus namnaonensis]OCA56605.1 hypothetical protein Phpb_00336 [Photorhabdus namnaonensis]